jgi:tRNA pseudouridine38-40 synthase
VRNIKLTLQYDGTDFCGLELQPGKRSIRGEIEKALSKLFKAKVKVISSSRTDSGVHALQNVVNFKFKNSIPVSRIPSAMNSILPEDIRILKAEAKAKDFNSRYAAKSKEYEYLIYNGKILSPAHRKFVWHVKPKLDLTAMRKAAKILVGKYDFSSFCASRSDDKDFVKKIYKLSIHKRKISIWGGEKLEVISFQIKGNGFLYKMVRNMVGTLVEVGLGKRSVSDIRKILSAKNRKLAGRTAPAQGLCLLKVNY